MLLEYLGLNNFYSNPGYVDKLFDQSYVHTIDIELENPNLFFDQAQNKEYQIASKQTILEICGHKIVIKYKKY